MYNNDSIKVILKRYIDNKINRFVIYPFGANGVNVKNILKDYFDLEPCFIVDNEYCRYNSRIIDTDTLQKVYKDDIYVIIAVENYEISRNMINELSGFIPLTNIINLHTQINKYCEGKFDGNGFLLQDFLPSLTKKILDKAGLNKIKIRIIHSSPTTWNAINTICHAFKEDSLFDLLIIIDGYKSEKMIEQVKRYGYKYVLGSEYQGALDEPDILILSGAFKKELDGMLECREHVKLCVVAYWSVIRYDDSIQVFWKRLRTDFGIYRPDYYLFDSLQYEEVKHLDYFSDRVIEMGNAKFDGIYYAVQDRKYINGWEKLEGKTTVLWATSHAFGNDMTVSKSLTFDLYAKTVFDYADRNPDMGFVFRPSIAFIDEMLGMGFWSRQDLRIFKEYCVSSPNVIFDETDTYDAAFSVADGVLTDAFCGVICSALPTLKPICAAYRSRKDVHWHENLASVCYSAYEREDIISFFEMLANKQDPMFKIRQEAAGKYIKSFDGKNGWRIKEFIKKKYFEREGEHK